MAYLEYCAAQSLGGRTGFFSQIARLELGRAIDEGPAPPRKLSAANMMAWCGILAQALVQS